ncbi:hypothetical protein GCM10027445_36210 [Amycolatopsis endophytica]|uniref:ABC-type glycerol-3-phosphate transport system substrate-binding protein n=1 Tax=Amycolatopsis endophytica TaxID=860233 RepID=A0A853BAI3_9PSEU|nr:hypothetical protein [Amycolatopsis endophytica]NYI92179.1 ABC-type glycerol-3-phosphate transport system substrate-binding protein [Amycolatopsis endophytica]
MTAPRRALALLSLTAAALAGCTDSPATTPSPGTPPPPATTATTTTTTTPPSTTTAAARSDECGTVTAASGLTLRVMDTTTSALDCGAATDLVTRFQQAITGRQPADSARPVSETVDGWLCVSGPPASQGGTSCSRGEDTVFAQVVQPE